LTDYNKTKPASLAEAGADILAVIDQCIEDASVEISTYLGQRYAISDLTEESLEQLKRLAVDMSIFNIYVLRNFSKVPEPVDKKNDKAIALLKDISKGIVKLNIGTDDAPAATQPDTAEYQGGGQMFTRNSLGGF
jgi:phage gp36-like protein